MSQNRVVVENKSVLPVLVPSLGTRGGSSSSPPPSPSWQRITRDSSCNGQGGCINESFAIRTSKYSTGILLESDIRRWLHQHGAPSSDITLYKDDVHKLFHCSSYEEYTNELENCNTRWDGEFKKYYLKEIHPHVPEYIVKELSSTNLSQLRKNTRSKGDKRGGRKRPRRNDVESNALHRGETEKTDKLKQFADMEGSHTEEGKVPDDEAAQTVEVKLPAGKDDRTDEAKLPAGEDDRTHEVKLPAGKDDRTHEVKLPAGEDDRTHEVKLPAGEDDRTHEVKLPAGEDDRTHEVKLPAGEDDRTHDVKLPAGEDDRTDEAKLPAGEDYQTEEMKKPDDWSDPRAEDPASVLFYDSLFHQCDVQQQVAAIYRTKSSQINAHFVDVQRQSGGSD
eukprot:Em0014g151a